MLRRFFGIGLVFVLLGLPLGYMTVNSENQTPWLIALFSYVVLGGLFGSRYVFFGRQTASAPKILGWLVLNGIVALTIAVGYMIIAHQL